MKHIKRQIYFIVTLLLVAGFNEFHAQECVNTTGGNITGSSASISYSVGQVVYTTNTGTNGSVAQGVQQPYEISVISAIEESNICLRVSAYPNPTTDYLTLSIGDSTYFDCAQYNSISNQSMSYQLYDMNGKLLQSEKISGNQTSIVMSNLVPADYFVKVIKGNDEVKTFKIIKN